MPTVTLADKRYGSVHDVILCYTKERLMAAGIQQFTAL